MDQLSRIAKMLVHQLGYQEVHSLNIGDGKNYPMQEKQAFVVTSNQNHWIMPI